MASSRDDRTALTGEAEAELRGRFPALRRLLQEASGALGDSGVLAPIALALIAVNGLHPSPLFLVFGIGYAVAG
ncbi:MAG: hypothetical protein PVG79_15375, partial [Gemmatimonadales bacterium]